MCGKLVFLFLLFAPVTHSSALFPSDLKQIGQADLKIFWFDIYEAKLFNAHGVYNGVERGMLLTLNYKRRIGAADLLEETEKQLKRFARATSIIDWMKDLKQMWRTVRKGDQLAFYIDFNGAGHFFYNRRWLGVIDEEKFSQAFINIWLSDQSDYPKLAKKLRGEFNHEKIN